MKILVYGSEGWIGKQVLRLLEHGDIEIIIGKSRISRYSSTKEEILEYNPTHVMAFIGRTHGEIDGKEYPTIDYLEQKGKLRENINDNLFAPLILARICEKYNIHYTYIGTGCIFQYNEDHPIDEINGFTEDSLPNFFGSSYSIVKGYTDRIMKTYDNVLNIRIRMPITSDYSSRNFITKILKYDKICSISNSMSVLPDLLPIMVDMTKKKITGTINLVNPGLISHNEILQMYKDIIDPEFTWKNFDIDEQDSILDSKRSNNYLDTTKLESMYPEIKNIKKSVKDILIDMSCINIVCLNTSI